MSGLACCFVLSFAVWFVVDCDGRGGRGMVARHLSSTRPLNIPHARVPVTGIGNHQLEHDDGTGSNPLLHNAYIYGNDNGPGSYDSTDTDSIDSIPR